MNSTQPLKGEQLETQVNTLEILDRCHNNPANGEQNLEKVVVGQIMSIDLIMKSTGLKGVTVDCGTGLFKTVSTANNLKVGMKTAFARLGALLSGQVYIQMKEIGGVESQGKLCSGFDLGFGNLTESVIEIQSEIENGTCLSDVAVSSSAHASSFR